jgi:DNA-binding SARP family transcriptional activator
LDGSGTIGGVAALWPLSPRAGETVVEFGLLGPLLVRREAEEIPVPAARQRVLLAALLFRANQVIPVDELADTLWDEGLPATARVTVRNYVKRLRQSLGDLDRSRIATRGDGYLIGVADGELDLARFEALREQAGQCARVGRWAEVSAALHAALALWRGQPLADVPSDVLARQELPRLAEARLQATEDRIDADLHLGRHGDLIAGLRQLAEAEPLRERLHELLMLALYRAGWRWPSPPPARWPTRASRSPRWPPNCASVTSTGSRPAVSRLPRSTGRLSRSSANSATGPPKPKR